MSGAKGVELAEPRELDFLVVDDHQSMRVIIGTLLRAFGPARIREADNGESALRALSEARADIIITDLKMPVMDGLEFVRRLRNDGKPGFDVPVIMVTGHANAARVMAARDVGVNEFIVKPINGAHLADRLKRIMHYERPFVRSAGYVGPCRRRRTPDSYSGPFRREDDAARIAEMQALGVAPAA